MASGLTSLTAGASRIFEGGAVNQTVVEMDRGFLFLMSVSDGSSLAVLAHPECDIGLVGYEMALLVDRAGSVLTPDLRAELDILMAARSSSRRVGTTRTASTSPPPPAGPCRSTTPTSSSRTVSPSSSPRCLRSSLRVLRGSPLRRLTTRWCVRTR